MRFRLYLTYCSLLCTTLLSSCCLFYVVAQENAKYVADAAAVLAPASIGAAETTTTTTTTTTISTATSNGAAVVDITEPPPLSAEQIAEEKVLPNYKKVKKLHDTEQALTAEIPHEADVSSSAGAVEADRPANQQVYIDDETRESVAENELSDSEKDKPVLANTNVVSDDTIAATSDSVSSEVYNVMDANETIGAEQPRDPEENDTQAEDERNTQETHNPNGRQESLPDITEIPTVTVTELPLVVLEPTVSSLDAIIIDGTAKSRRDPENVTVDILENSNESMQKDEQIIKINDSGGGDFAAAAEATESPHKAEEYNIPSDNDTVASAAAEVGSGVGGIVVSTVPSLIPGEQSDSDAVEVPTTASTSSSTVTVNPTVEEVPMPVFSEWAQKQMEAAEKQQAMEQEVVNTSTQKKNNTSGGGRPPQLKIRSKNYASPDCGAKIITSNSGATNIGAVLSSPRDEYMLSPCGNRIWFVVELCEAIQAQRIDLANFELFSSSPKNFTVAVSNRFPTRDWSNVGRFVAEDKRTVQSFELHPHLFGKFVRVDIHSHYSKEHFCPVSLFRVFGTSEFEAFETENHPHEDMDDFDDEEQAVVKNPENNLFKSASDAVFSIMKKAAEALVKPASNQNQSLTRHAQLPDCSTPAFPQFSCAECNSSLVERINNALSCESRQLLTLLGVPRLRTDLLNSHICAKQYGIELVTSYDCSLKALNNPFEMDIKRSFYLNILPTEYIGALCQLLAAHHGPVAPRKGASAESSIADARKKEGSTEVPLNLTIDKKVETGDFEMLDNTAKKLLKPEATSPSAAESDVVQKPPVDPLATASTTEPNMIEHAQLPPPLASDEDQLATTTSTPEAPKETAPDVNIFNVPGVEKADVAEPDVTAEASGDHMMPSTEAPTTTTTTTQTPELSTVAARSDEDPSAWDSFDNLLGSTAQPGGVPQTGSGNAGFNGNNMQHKIPSSPQSESVFIRLSNRIKALERNMSLSGQYLEELSRRYKKQVEELQQTLTQQSQTVRTLEQQLRRQAELEQLYAQSNVQLQNELNDLTLHVHACIVVIILVGGFMLLVLMVGIIFYRSMRRQSLEFAKAAGDSRNAADAATAATNETRRKLNRRKSYEDFSDHQKSLSQGGEKLRRPSEEAMLILKDCGSDSEVRCALESIGDTRAQSGSKRVEVRQRKISVCYGSSGNVNAEKSTNSNNNNNSGNSNSNFYKAQMMSKRRQGYMNAPPPMQHAWQRLEQFEEYDNLAKSGKRNLPESVSKQKPHLGGQSAQSVENHKSAKTKKKAQHLKRQESAPSDFPSVARLNVTAPGELNRSDLSGTTIVDYDESLMLDDEDLDNFIPTSDLAYNEFMPDGPSGYQIVNDPAINDPAAQKAEKSAEKKSRRLSSPAFFKSPFGKSLKGKSLNASLSSSTSSKTTTPHESTSWEWYRLRKSEAQQHQQKQHIHTSSSATGISRTSPVASIDSASLSEINFPTNCTENSFRILEEAILTSGESAINGKSPGANGNAHSSSSSGDSSNRSSTSSTAKKRNRTFNRIFRKVF